MLVDAAPFNDINIQNNEAIYIKLLLIGRTRTQSQGILYEDTSNENKAI